MIFLCNTSFTDSTEVIPITAGTTGKSVQNTS